MSKKKQNALTGERREKVGSRATKVLRRAGKVPAVLYGHGKGTVHLALDGEATEVLLRSHAHMVDLTVDGQVEAALVQAAEFDLCAERVLHVDFLRVAADEEVQVDVELKLVGTSKGEKEGGTVDQAMHTVAVRCLPADIPEVIEVLMAELEMGTVVHAVDLELPPRVTLAVDPDAGVVAIKHPAGEDEPVVAEEDEAAEPELIKPERAGDEAEDGK